MTKIDDTRRAARRARLRRFVQAPSLFLALGLAISNVVRGCLHDGLYRSLVEAVLALAILAGAVAYSRLRSRKALRKLIEPKQIIHSRESAAPVKTAASTNRAGLDFWTVVIPLLILFGTLFARSRGWLGNNAPERTTWTVDLGLVFIAGVCRLWWRDRKHQRALNESRSRQANAESREEK